MSDILSRLQQQGADFGETAQRGQDMVNSFDTDKFIQEGTDYAYKMGKEQLGAIVGGEVVAGLHQGLPLITKTTKYAYNRINGMPKSSKQGGGDNTGNPNDGGEAPRVKTDNVMNNDSVTENDLQGAGRDERNLNYNVEAGRIEDSLGNPAKIGGERTDTDLTPLERQFRNNPEVGEGGVENIQRLIASRPDMPNIDFSTRGANLSANTRYQQEVEARAQQAKANELPTEGLGDGSVRSQPAQPPAQSIGARPVEGEYQGPQQTYTRPGTSIKVTSEDAVKSSKFTPTSSAQQEESGYEPNLEDISSKYGVGSKFTGVADAEDARIAKIPTPPGEAPKFTLPSTKLELPDKKPNLVQRTTTTVEPADPKPTASLDELFPAPPTPAVLAQPTRQAPSQPNVDDIDQDLQQRLTQVKTYNEFDGGEDDKPALGGDKPAVGDDTGEAIEKNLKDIAPEEEIADEIPGVGDIIGGLLGIGAAISGAVEASKTPKAPQQSPGTPAFQTAYDSAPVIDSDSYHHL